MWLPTPIYERIPQFWLLLGLLFMSSGTYVGFDYSVSFLYFGVGLFSCVWSLYVFVLRSRSRKISQVEQSSQPEQSLQVEQSSQPEPSRQDERPEQLAPSVHQSTEQTS